MLGASIVKTTGTPCSALTPHVQMEVAGLSLRDFVAAEGLNSGGGCDDAACVTDGAET